MVRIFEQVKGEGGFWGVFVVLQFPGLGVDASGEEKQGKVCLLFSLSVYELCECSIKMILNVMHETQMIADLSHKYGVESFIYSSAMRLGEKYEKDLKYSAGAKVKIEEHVMGLGEKGLGWT